MSGRNYNVSANVPLQQSNKEKKKSSFFENMMYEDWDLEEEPNDEKYGIFSAFQFCLIIIFVAAVITTALVYLIAVVRFDYKHGASTSNELVTEISANMNQFDYDYIKSYLPRTIRSDGFIADSDEFAIFRNMCNENKYKLKSSAILNETVFLDTALLENGLLSAYHKNVSISEAKLTQTELIFSDADSKSVCAVANIISIKILHKWYFYTGSPVSYENNPVVFITVQDNAGDKQVSSDISYTEKTEVIESAEDVIPLDFYDGAKSDLTVGKCMINNIEYQIPDSFSVFSDIFTLNKDKLPASQSLTLSEDAVLGNLPVVYADDSFQNTVSYVSVANLSKDSVAIQDASITTLCFSDGNLSVLLPGNVTFGTSYADISKMYGGLQKTDDLQFKGKLSDTVYVIDLKNHRNKIYFGFKSDKLIEIQWYYIDMTDYHDI